MVSGSLEGSCGRWQARLAILLALPVLLTGMYCTNYVFLAAHTNHRCKVSECENTSWTSDLELSSEGVWSPIWSSWALPEDDNCQKFQAIDPHCTVNSFDNTSRVVCEDFVYESQRSIVAEFDLGCQDWKRTLVGTVHNVGMLISLPIIGYVSDRWGRRTALVVSGTGVGVFGLMKSFVPNYPLYLVMEFVETVLGASVYPAAFVLMIEWLGVEQRILASLVLGIPLSAGAATLALLDWLTGYWRHWARIAYPPSFLILFYLWVLPESVRWLITNGRLSEALDVLKRAARYNKVDINDEALEKMLMSEVEQKGEKEEVVEVEEEGLLKAFIRYPTLRRRLLVCFAWWMSAVFVFYGLAVRAQALAGSPHANYALVAAAELPALLINTLLLDRLGRRPMLTVAFLITAIALTTIPCLPDQSSWIGTALYLAGKMGATMTLNALYIYTAELFPTRARHRLLAACSTLGRVGSILAPQTPLLAKYKVWLPTLLFGALPLLSAALTPLVPDTLHKKLPDTYADLDRKSPSYVSRREV